MSKLTDYLAKNAEQGDGYPADVVFFQVNAGPEADANVLRELVREHKGEWADVDLFDGEEHSYIELGCWIGDQSAALTLMGLGALLGLWKLLTPRTVLGTGLSDDVVWQLATLGYVMIQS